MTRRQRDKQQKKDKKSKENYENETRGGKINKSQQINKSKG